MKIYIIERGEQHEGGYIVGVFSTRERAIEAASKQVPCFEGGWKQKENDYWENGCDFLTVSEYTLDKEYT